MNFNQFVGQEIVNANNENGTVVFCDETHIVVKYQNVEKTYYPSLAFNNMFLTFKRHELDSLIKEDLKKKDEQTKQNDALMAKNTQILNERRIRVNKIYKELYVKNCVMKSLFGSDFLYPPYVQFKNKYKHLIIEKKIHEWGYSGYLWKYYV